MKYSDCILRPLLDSAINSRRFNILSAFVRVKRNGHGSQLITKKLTMDTTSAAEQIKKFGSSGLLDTALVWPPVSIQPAAPYPWPGAD